MSLSFLPLCSVLIYHGYTNTNIDLYWVRTQLYIFPANKHPYSSDREFHLIKSNDVLTFFELKRQAKLIENIFL